jgi:hypothetical protein
MGHYLSVAEVTLNRRVLPCHAFESLCPFDQLKQVRKRRRHIYNVLIEIVLRPECTIALRCSSA